MILMEEMGVEVIARVPVSLEGPDTLELEGVTLLRLLAMRAGLLDRAIEQYTFTVGSWSVGCTVQVHACDLCVCKRMGRVISRMRMRTSWA